MAQLPREELISSIKELHNNPEYSDLTISSRDKTYNVHKAIVCPRSEFFAAQCRDASASTDSPLDLHDDDPQAVDMVVRYLYYLDYPSVPLESPAELNGHTNGDHPEEFVLEGENGVNGYTSSQPDEGPRAETPDSKPEGEVPDPPKSKKAKKKAKRKSIAKAPTEESVTEEDPAAPVAETAPDGPPQEESLNGHEPRNTQNGLIVHAKVYTLSKKYGIRSLRRLALEKFEGESENQWDTDNFLQAAKEVYTSGSRDEDGEMRDIITTAFHRHKELLDKEETEEILRSLPVDLVCDILMRMHKEGGH